MPTFKTINEQVMSDLSDQLHKSIHPTDIPTIKKYTTISKFLNRALISGKTLTKSQKDIHDGLMSSAKPIGHDITLYSGTGDTNFGLIARHSKDGILHSKAHISATHDHNVASQFAFAVGGKSQMIHIHMKSSDKGVHVSKISNHPDEHETVIPAGTKLKYLRSEEGKLTGGLYDGKKVTIHHFTIHSQE